MLILSLGIGALMFGIGLITYYLAPRVGPNPFFGVRVGYSYANREVWGRSNRAGGFLFALGGAATALLGLIMSLLNIPIREGATYLMVLVILLALGGTVWLFWYARRLASGTAIQYELKKVAFRRLFVAPVLLAFLVLVVMAVLVYPSLPAARMATHFNIANEPDGYMPRDLFMLNYLGMAALIVVLDLVIVAIATREPLIAFGRWGPHWQLDPEQGLVYAGVTFGVVMLFLAAILWDVATFNITGAHAFPLLAVFGAVGVIIVLAVVLFFRLARKA